MNNLPLRVEKKKENVVAFLPNANSKRRKDRPEKGKGKLFFGPRGGEKKGGSSR